MKRPAELRVLKSFITVAHEGGVSRAANVLHLTQPAVSLHLKQLAKDTGLTLFDRTSKGMSLTQDGAKLLIKAEKVFTALSEFGETATQISGRVHGRLRIGTIVDPYFIRLGQLLARLVETYPGLRTELSHGMSGEVITGILRDQIDVGYFLGDMVFEHGASERSIVDADEAIHRVELAQITYRVVAPSGWDKLVLGKDLAALSELPWIGTPPASVHSRLLNRRFSELGCTQNRVAVVDQEPAMLAMVRSGVGLSLCQESIALEQRQLNGLTVSDRVTINTPLSFVTLRTRMEETNIAVAFDALRQIWSK